jgi:glycosyltransferase involved in cell wall biosynthesis
VRNTGCVTSQHATVGVALCTFNGTLFLGEQLGSLISQTRRPDLVIIGDDGSTDSTLELLEQFAGVAPFPVTIRRNRKRLGFADNFLSTAQACQTDVVAFCDQDDMWYPHKLERLTAPFDDPEVLVAIHAADVVDEELVPLGFEHPRLSRTQVAQSNCVDPWFAPPGFAMAVSRRLLAVDGHDERPQCHLAESGVPKPHDQWLYFLGSAFGRVAFLSERLCAYRQHTDNVCGAGRVTAVNALRRARLAGGLEYEARAQLAASYAECLDKIATRRSLHTDDRRRGLAAAAWWRAIASDLERRATLYDDRVSCPKRLIGLGKLITGGAYRSRASGRLGLRALAKDAYTSVRGGGSRGGRGRTV